nr:MAG TPA: hypothetical protein [Caudoviricetes sp.]
MILLKVAIFLEPDFLVQFLVQFWCNFTSFMI